MNIMTRTMTWAVALACLISSPQATEAQPRDPKSAPSEGKEASPKAADERAPKGETTGKKESGRAAGRGEPACPIVPMNLAIIQRHPEGQLGSLFGPAYAMALDEDGKVRMPLLSASLGLAEYPFLDSRGCIGTAFDVWADQTKSGTIWTIRQEMKTAECGLQLATAWLMIDKDGVVRRQKGPKTGPDPSQPPTLKFEGFTPEACCAARLMLAAYMGMMPSMAVSDGNPVKLAPPKNSACPERHKEK